MRKARNRIERSRQVLNWLISEWPPGRRVDLEWVGEIVDVEEPSGKHSQCYGQTYRDGRGIIIQLSLKKCHSWEGAADTLIHEYVHAVQWGPASLEGSGDDHPVSFYALKGEIENRWFHDHGWEQANEYPFD